jgi:hypothetical protein
MSRIATVKETGLELSQEEWMRFEEAVAASLHGRPEPWPFARSFKASGTEQLLPPFHHTSRESWDFCFKEQPAQP